MDMIPVTTVGVLLAAGRGSRFTGPTPKLLAPLRGRTVLAWSLAAARGAGFAHLVVVTGAVDVSAELAPNHEVHVVANPDWADGQATSITAGIERARLLGADAVVIGLADQPFVSPEAWRSVAASGSPIAVATYDGVRGNPVRLAESVWSLLPTTGDVGARDLMRLRPELVREVACEGSADDIDTEEDLAPWT